MLKFKKQYYKGSHVRTFRLLTLGLGLLAATSANSTDFTFNNATGNNSWAIGGNWSPASVPGFPPNDNVSAGAIFGGGVTTVNMPGGNDYIFGGATFLQPGWTLNNQTVGPGNFVHLLGAGLTGQQNTFINNTGAQLFFEQGANANATWLVNNGTTFINANALGPSAASTVTNIGALSGGGNLTIAGTSPGLATVSIGGLHLDTTYTGTFTNGPGLRTLRLEKTGRGTLILTGNSTHNGATTISEGTLQLDGAFNSTPITVFNNGRLTGMGSTIFLFNGGVTEPGNSNNFFENFTTLLYLSTSQGGILRFHVAPTTSSSLVVTPGPFGAFLSPRNVSLLPIVPQVVPTGTTTLDLVFTAGRYNTGTSTTLINAAGTASGVQGTFSSITGATPRLIPTVIYGGNNVRLTVAERPFADVWRIFFGDASGNEISQTGAWDFGSLNPTVGLDFSTVIGFLNVLPAPQLRSAFRSLGATTFASAPRASFQNANFVTNIIQNPTVIPSDIPGCIKPCPPCPPCPPAPCPPAPCPQKCAFVDGGSVSGEAFYKRATLRKAVVTDLKRGADFERAALALKDSHGSASREMAKNIAAHHPGKGYVWVQGFGARTEADDYKFDPGFESTTTGGMLGVDYGWNETTRLGVGGGYMKSKIDYNHALGKNDLDGPFFSFWGVKTFDNFEVDGSVLVQRTEHNTTRNIIFPGVNRTAKAKFNGYTFMKHVGLSYNVDVNSFHVKPFLAFDLYLNHENAFTETGANSLNITAKKRQASELQSSVGFSVDKHICLDCGVLMPLVRFAYRNRTHIRDDGVRAFYVNQPVQFNVRNQYGMRHHFAPQLELGYAMYNNSNVKIGYSGDIGKDERTHMGYMSVGFTW